MAQRAYYVVYDSDSWRVKLERGRYLSTHRKKTRAVAEAKRLARKPGTAGSKVVVNKKNGATQRHIKNP